MTIVPLSVHKYGQGTKSECQTDGILKVEEANEPKAENGMALKSNLGHTKMKSMLGREELK